jgi:uncharacterized protein (TIGR04255 family)
MPAPDALSCVLDIDAFSVSDEVDSQEAMWAALDQLRHLKNKVFFASITPAVRSQLEDQA